MAQQLRQTGSIDNAKALIDSAKDICPYDPNLLVEQAHLAEFRQDFLLAEQYRYQALTCGHVSPQVLTWLANNSYRQHNTLRQARQLAEQAIATLGENESAEVVETSYETLARVAFLQGDHDRAQETLRAVQQRLDRNPDANPEIALLEFAAGSLEPAKTRAIHTIAQIVGNPYQEICERFEKLLEAEREAAAKDSRRPREDRERRRDELDRDGDPTNRQRRDENKNDSERATRRRAEDGQAEERQNRRNSDQAGGNDERPARRNSEDRERPRNSDEPNEPRQGRRSGDDN